MKEELLLVLASVSSVLSLTCYICGDTNLDELGECSTQFQYDCGTYASRFSANERIYCRTTRHGAKNNTFTIMKECISEQDHYRTFPEKGYRLDEECDLVNIKGEEVAYCLCRSDYCNRNPIADQFMAFEEKHPELFGDVEDSKSVSPPSSNPPSKPSFRNMEPPLKVQTPPIKSSPTFAAPILNPPAIVPVNDLRTGKSSEMIEIRRAQLPSRSSVESEIVSGASEELAAGPAPVLNLPRNVISEGMFVGSGAISPRNDANQSMKCVQCGDGNLLNEHDECKRQIQVECPSQNSMCFTRRIAIGNGMFGIEKMCVLPEQLVNEFGESARFEGCGSSNGGKVQYCACRSSVCNQLPLEQQRKILKIIPESKSNRVPELAAPDLPIPSPPSFPSHQLYTTPFTPIATKWVGIVATPSQHQCYSCMESDMADPTADCLAAVEKSCDSSEKYCVTKQTQISTSSFAMEKRCLSDKEASIFLPGEKLEIGCATSESGMVNYCICTGKLCNRPSLLQQAQMSGVRDSLEEQRLVEEEIRKQQTLSNSLQDLKNKNVPNDLVENKKKLPPVFLDEDDSLEVAKDIRTEEDIINQRQREWAKADVNNSESKSVFLYSILLFLLAFL